MYFYNILKKLFCLERNNLFILTKRSDRFQALDLDIIITTFCQNPQYMLDIRCFCRRTTTINYTTIILLTIAVLDRHKYIHVSFP